MRRSIGGLLILAGLFTILSVTSAASEVRLRAATIHSPSQPFTLSLKRWAAAMDKETNGEIKVSVFDSGSVVSNQQDAYSQVKTGTVDLTLSIVVKDDVPGLQIATFPYAFRGYEDWRKFMNGPAVEKMKDEFRAKTGIRLFDIQYLGSRHLTANKPIKIPEDLQGVKLRAVEVPIFLETLRAMGALATPIAFQEVLSSLKTGVIEGQENPIPTIHQMKFYEAQKYIMLTGHMMGGDFWMMNERKFQSLTPAQQQIVLRTVKEAIAWGEDLIVRQEKELLAELQAKGMTVIGPEQGLNVQAFIDRVRANAWPKLRADVGGAVLDAIIASEKTPSK
jgi:TRAP-type transport system periplasmic protein